MALVSGVAAGGSAEMAWSRTTRSAPDNGRASLARVGAPRERAVLMRATVEARAALEEAVVAAAVAAQRARSLTMILEEALADLATPEEGHGRPAPAAEVSDHAEALSPREREVLALVAEGRSNKAIAAALYVSPNTIKTHVASLLSKLHAHSRVQLAVIAARQVAY